MDERDALERLRSLSRRLADLQTERATVWQAWHRTRYSLLDQGILQGLSATASRDRADAEVVELRCDLERLNGEISACEEERDHLRFFLTHLTGREHP